MKLLITGSTGTVGKHVINQVPDTIKIYNSNSKHSDLTDIRECFSILDNTRPTHVIHLAGKVGGIKANQSDPVGFLETNLAINTNFIHACAQSPSIQKVICCLSTCIYPDRLDDSMYPMTEDLLHEGAPPRSNLSYAVAKRAMAVHCDAYNSTLFKDDPRFYWVAPCNLYSEYDDAQGDKAHFITAMMNKIKNADSDTITLLGTGKPLRQFMYAGDLARALILMLTERKYGNVNICPNNNMSIKDLAYECLSATYSNHLKLKFTNNPEEDGQYRKDASNAKFMRMFPKFKFTTLSDGLRKIRPN